MIRSIFAKILLWFWISMFLVVMSVVAVSLASGAEPAGRRWLSHTLELYGSSAVDFYSHGGVAQLSRYLDDIQKSSGIQSALLDPKGEDVANRGVPAASNFVLAEARATGESQFRASFHWTGASVISRPEGDYIFVASIQPLRGYFRAFDLRVMLLRLVIGLLSAGLLSYLLARHIGKPIAALQAAAGQIARGDLSVRATPAIEPRADELADLARDFDRMAERIQALIQKQQELLGDISHELRSPLTRLTVSLELARRGDTEAFSKMEEDLQQLDEMIGEILTLTRLQAHEAHALDTQVDLRALLERVIADAQIEGKRENKYVAMRGAGECRIQGDANLLRSCFENVIRNAVRYTRPDTNVEIHLACESNAAKNAVILVEDRGPGVPPEALGRMFEPFYRVEESRDRATGGTGLGLSIAQKVVALHGGKITARNREGGGLSVEIMLPYERSVGITSEDSV
jgi:two-component system, OmpR family, sensor histidine kinase CpxA